MEQERLLWRLQEFVQEEYLLKKKQDLMPLIKCLKDLQGNIKDTEAQSQQLEQQIEEMEKKSVDLEKRTSTISQKVKEGKEKLYDTKGGALKELLGLQQSIFKMEEEIEKGEILYYEMIKTTEELKEKAQQVNEITKGLKKEYNREVKKYKELLNQLELKLAENRLKQEDIKERLAPEKLQLFSSMEKRFPRNPLAVIKGGSCSGCNISISSALAIRVREGKNICRCENCGRVLINL